MILARSPHIRFFDDSGLVSVQLRLYIYTGTKTTDEVLRYTFARDAVDGEVAIDISPYIRDYLVFSESTQSRAVWVHTEVAKDTGGGLGAFAADLAEEISAYGYTDPVNGVNDSSEYDALDYFITEQPYLVKPPSKTNHRVAVKLDDGITPIVEWFDAADGGGSSISSTAVLGDLDESSQQFVRVNPPATAKSAVYKINSIAQETINITHKSEEIYSARRIGFVNKFGQYEYLWFYGRTVDNFNYKDDQYKRNILSGGSYDAASHSNKVLKKAGRQSVTLNTGWYQESFNETFKQLMLSEEVWLLSEDEAANIPVNLVNSGFQEKTSAFDRVINYSFTFEYSHSLVNDIV